MATTQLIAVAVLIFGGVTGMPLDEVTSPVHCDDSSMSDVKTEEDLFNRLLPRVLSPRDDNTKIEIKRMFMQYLIQSRTFLDMIRCTNKNLKSVRLLQEDEDGDDGDDGGGGGGAGAGGAGGLGGAAGGALNNANVLNGVRRILANVFTGNLIGVIQEGVALRGPEGVTTVFTDVLSTLFGSAATAGITGVLGNLTTTARPQSENTTFSYEEQQYLLQQQQLILAQQQGQLGQGYPGQVGVGGAQGLGQGQPLGQGQFPAVGGVAGGSNQHYPQFQQQQQNFPSNQGLQQQQLLGGGQTQQGIRRRPGAGQQQQQQQVFQQQSQAIPIKPQAQIPQQPQQAYPQQNQQLAGGLHRQHQQQGGLQNQQFGGGLQGQQFAGALHGKPSQLAGGLQRQPAVQGQGNNRIKLTQATPPPQEADYYEDNDEE